MPSNRRALFDDVDALDRLGSLGVRANLVDGVGEPEVGGDGDVVRRHQTAGRSVRPADELLDVLGRFRIDLLELLEQRLVDGRRKNAEEVRAVVGVHLRRDARDRPAPHELGQSMLAIFVETREHLRRVVGGQRRDELRCLVVVEVGDDFGDVLGMDLVEQLDDLVRALAHETDELRTDEARQAHGALYHALWSN